MSLYPRPLDAILAAIKDQNGITLVESQYTFGTPTPYTDASGKTNTSLSITVNGNTSPYQGNTTVYYKRLNLSDLSVLLPLPIQAQGLVTVADFRNLLVTNFGLNFVAGDLNDSDPVSLDVNGAGNITLTAQANSMGWIGTVTLPVIKGNFDLAQYVTTTTLPGILYPNRDESKPYGEMYSYWRDFTSQQSVLAAITTDTTDLTALAGALTAVTGNTWVTDAPARYSLQGAVIAYNGPVSGYTSPQGGSGNPAYLNLLVVTLSATGSLGYSGLLYLHYGLNDGFGS
jgi:hypothetical protein